MRNENIKERLFMVGFPLLALSAHAVEWTVTACMADGLTGPQQLTNALVQAASGDTIRVEPGVYDLSTTMMSDDSCLVLSRPVTILGTDTTSWRTTASGETAVVFDAHEAGRILQAKDVIAPEIRHVTFKNAKTSGHGAAVYSNKDWSQRPLLTNCVISTCSSTDGQGAGVYGGIIRDCLLTNNVAKSWGGGAAMVDLYDSQVVGNESGGSGGGVVNARALQRTTFIGNKAVNGGAIAVQSEITVSSCAFSNNWATSQGGAVWADSSKPASSLASCRDCVFSGNRADSFGGGACCYVCILTNCPFVGNVSTYTRNDRWGGAALVGATNSVVDCAFIDNESKGNGGAVSRSANLLRCAFTNNVAAFDGGAAYRCTAVRQCDFRGNRANFGSALSSCAEVVDCVFSGDVKTKAYDCYNTTNIVDSLFVNDSSEASTNGVGYCVGVVGCMFTNTVAWYSAVERCGFFAHRDDDVCVFRSSAVTNSLLTGCESRTPIGAYSTLVNCTIFSNGLVRQNRQLAAGNFTAVNCIFHDNYRRLENGVVKTYDIAGYGTWTFRNCLYKTHPGWNVGDTPTYTFNDTDCVYTSAQLFVNPSKPAFDPVHPYKLRLRSPARDRGLAVVGADKARDFADAGRLNGTIDIGCYECWLEPSGALLIVR